MPIVDTDILFKFSVSAAAGNTTAGTAATSLGDQVSTTQVTGAALNNIFDDISAAENVASDDEYRCLFAHNTHATLTLIAAVVYVESEVAGGAVIALGADPTAASAVGSGSAQAVNVANEDGIPAGVTFSTTATSPTTGVALGNIGPGQVKPFWVRRTAANTVAINNDGGVIRIWGETNA